MKATVKWSAIVSRLPEEIRARFTPDEIREAEVTRKAVSANPIPPVKSGGGADGDGVFRAYASTRHVDLVGDILVPDGVDLGVFQKNPVILWAHNYSHPPVAQAVKQTVDNDGVILDMKFATTERGREIEQLWREGILRTMSVGFNVLDSVREKAAGFKRALSLVRQRWADITDDGAKEIKQIIHRWRLYEASIVPLPCNPNALALSVGKGIVKLSPEMLRELNVKTVDDSVPDGDRVKAGFSAAGRHRVILTDETKYDYLVVSESGDGRADVFGVIEGPPIIVEKQSVLFDASRFTPEAARAVVGAAGLRYREFVPHAPVVSGAPAGLVKGVGVVSPGVKNIPVIRAVVTRGFIEDAVQKSVKAAIDKLRGKV